MPQRNVATNFTFEQQRAEINLLASDFWSQKTTVDNAASTYLKHDGSNNFTGATLAVPNAFTINSNSGNGTVTISGNLDVTGTTTTVSSANLEVTDKNILISKGSTTDAQADGAGITIDSGTDITWNFVDANDAWVSSIGVEATTHVKAARGQFTGATTPTAGSGVEVNAPDANTGQIIAYNRGTTAYNELRVKGTSVGVYTGSTNALVGTFNSTGLTMESGKNITGNVTGNADTATSVNVTDESTNTLTFPLFVTASVSGGLVQTANLAPKAGSNFYFNSSTGALSATSFSGTINTAAQPNITSLGELSSLNVDTNSGTDNHTIANFNGLITGGNMAGLKIQYYACGTDDARAGLYWQHENVGNHRMWMDDAGILRQKSSNPANDTDGEPYVRLGTTNTGTLTLTGDITASGKVLIGSTSNSSSSKLCVNGAVGTPEAFFELNRTDDPANGQNIGVIEFSQGSAASRLAARIMTRRDGGVWGASSLPTRFEFHTCISGSNSATEKLRIASNGNVLPGADNTQDLGSSSMRWANVYTGDMHLNNMNSGGNEIDGSEGHWTMQEGSDDLFLINRNTGKKYKFNLTEVS